MEIRMNQKMITCPKCGEKFELSEAISHDIEEEIKKKYENDKQKLMENHGKQLAAKDEEFRKKMDNQKNKIVEDTKTSIEESYVTRFKDLEEQLKEKETQIEKGRNMEIELLRQQRQLEEKNRKIELDFLRKMETERKKIIEDLSSELEEKNRLILAEKNKQLNDMKNQIDVLKRKAEVSSQQLKGEVLELELEDLLKNEFPFDEISPITKGMKGADIIQIVKTQSGKPCGKILWETKRTKSWSDSWIQKLKDDQRSEKADIAVLVSEVLPKGFSNFRQIKEVWVSEISSSLSLGLALRVVLIQVSREREFQKGKKEKMELIYSYLTGPEFRNRVEAVIEGFIAMKTELDAEKRAMEKIWSKREKQIEKVVYNLSGMHGDLEGIAGKALPAVKALELPSK
jgi:hypothetical protein